MEVVNAYTRSAQSPLEIHELLWSGNDGGYFLLYSSPKGVHLDAFFSQVMHNHSQFQQDLLLYLIDVESSHKAGEWSNVRSTYGQLVDDVGGEGEAGGCEHPNNGCTVLLVEEPVVQQAVQFEGQTTSHIGVFPACMHEVFQEGEELILVLLGVAIERDFLGDIGEHEKE